MKKRNVILIVLVLGFAGFAIIGMISAQFGLAAFVRSFLVEAFEIEGPSMAPSYIDGDRVLVDKTGRAPALGEVVIVETVDGMSVMKRVVALEGDSIAIVGDVLVRNGEEVPRTRIDVFDGEECFEENLDGVRYRIMRSSTSPSSESQRLTVPPGSIYVLGDHRDRSNDSRFFGPIPSARIIGVVTDHYYRATPRNACEVLE